MRSGSSRSTAGGKQAGGYEWWGRAFALALSLAASACANVGQIGNFIEERSVSVAFESVDGLPPALQRSFAKSLNEEAAAVQIAVVPPAEANFRLRGYLASQPDARGTMVMWAWDVYGADQRRAMRFSGTEQGNGSAAAADEQVLRRVARASVQQLAQLTANRRPSQAAVSPERRQPAFAGWFDDWTPESSGIFRILRREQPAQSEGAPAQGHTQAVPVPRGRPSPGEMASDPALAFAPAER